MRNVDFAALLIEIQRARGMTRQEAVDWLDGHGCGWREYMGEDELNEQWIRAEQCFDCLARRVAQTSFHNLQWLYEHNLLGFTDVVSDIEAAFSEEDDEDDE